ncbi:MAG: translocation/assembly module TamB domain-containing protein [Methyloprofundus sp.]|nr:translocation/assembly module TamB domain-containing protein [Methyloprofundus sp.]
MKTLFCIGLAALVSIFLLIGLLLTLLLYSPKFNNWLVLQAVSLVPEVSIEKVDGLLLGDMQLSGLSYQSEQADVNIRSIAYRYQLANLFDQQVLFESLQIAGVDVTLKESTRPKQENKESTEFVMPVTLEIRDFSLTELQIKQAEASHLVKQIHLALWYQGQSVRLSQFTLDSDIAQLHGAGELLINAQLPFKVELAIAKSAADFGELKAQVSAHGNLDKIYLNADLQAPSKAHAQGWVLLTEAVPSFDLQIIWAALQWPLQGAKEYAGENMQLSLKGTAEQYALTLDAKLFAQDFPLGQLHLVAQGDTQQLTLSDLSLEALQGNIRSKGRISWIDNIASDLQLTAQKIQLASLLPEYPGEFNLAAKLTGRLIEKQDIRVQINRFDGPIMDKQLNAKADIRYQPETTTIKQLQVSVGNNQLTMQGALGDQNKLTFKLAAADLHQLNPDLQGALFAQGDLQGTLSKPSVRLDLHSDGISFQEQKIGALQAHANLISAGTGQLDLDLKAQQIALPGLEIEKLSLQSSGQLAQHQINAAIVSSQGNVKLAAKGDLKPQKSWQGELEQLQILNSPAGDWQLIQRSPLTILFAQQDTVQIQTDVCLTQSSSTGLLCVNAKPERSGQKIDGSIKQLALSTFAAWMPDNLAINSALNSDFSLLHKDNLEGTINVNLDAGSIVVNNQQTGKQQLDFTTAQVHAQLDANQLRSNISIELDAAKHITGQIKIQEPTQMAKAKIDGKLNISIDDLGFLNTLIKPIANIEGSVNADIYAQGNLSAPDLKGTQIQLTKAKFNVPDAGMQVTDLNVTLTHGQAQQLFFKGSANIADQPLLIEGELDHYASDQLQFKMAAKGTNLQLLQLPKIQAWLSPDLTFSGNKQGVKIRGEVLVPKATLVFTTLPEGSVSLSDDEVVINEKAITVKPSTYPIDMSVFIQMGDAVSIEGFGLKSHLQGRLRAEMQNNEFKLYNQLTLLNATYKAYGQDLTIEKGQLLFDGDINNAGVNILASRRASDWNDKTIAYLSLTGMLSNPRSSVYTKPALSESGALAYLLTGGPLNKSGGSKEGMLAKAALGLGSDYVDALKSAVSIDELDIKSTAVGQNSMVLGKRIAPDLMVRYIVDILSAQMQLAVEYRLTEHISIETRAGSAQSSDIKYTIEFD